MYVPDLRHGDIVVMDNRGSHNGHLVRAMIEAAGAKLLSLPYGPDFNPIFSTLKAGRADTANDPPPLEMFETVIHLEPRSGVNLTPIRLQFGAMRRNGRIYGTVSGPMHYFCVL